MHDLADLVGLGSQLGDRGREHLLRATPAEPPSQETSASTEQIATSAQNLSDTAVTLERLVARFRVND